MTSYFFLRGQKEVTKKKATPIACPADTLALISF